MANTFQRKYQSGPDNSRNEKIKKDISRSGVLFFALQASQGKRVNLAPLNAYERSSD